MAQVPFAVRGTAVVFVVSIFVVYFFVVNFFAAYTNYKFVVRGRYAYIFRPPPNNMVWRKNCIIKNDWEHCSSCGKSNVPLLITEIWHEGCYHDRSDDGYCRDCLDEKTWVDAEHNED